MRAYAKLKPQFYTGRTGRELRRQSKDARILAPYLVVAPPSNMYGLYHISRGTMTEHTGLTLEEVEGALRSLAALQYAYYDEDAEHVWVVEMARIQMNAPLSPGDKLVRNVNNWYHRDCAPNRFLHPFFERYHQDLHLSGSPRTEGPAMRQLLRPEDADERNLETMFNVFLEAYPPSRRVGGKEGFETFVEAMASRGNDHLEVMLLAIEDQKASKQWRADPTLIPSMARWLKEERWKQVLPRDVNLRRHRATAIECGHEPRCTSAAEHALRVEVEQVCRHQPACSTFAEHQRRDQA